MQASPELCEHLYIRIKPSFLSPTNIFFVVPTAEIIIIIIPMDFRDFFEVTVIVRT